MLHHRRLAHGRLSHGHGLLGQLGVVRTGSQSGVRLTGISGRGLVGGLHFGLLVVLPGVYRARRPPLPSSLSNSALGAEAPEIGIRVLMSEAHAEAQGRRPGALGLSEWRCTSDAEGGRSRLHWHGPGPRPRALRDTRVDGVALGATRGSSAFSGGGCFPRPDLPAGPWASVRPHQAAGSSRLPRPAAPRPPPGGKGRGVEGWHSKSRSL